MTQTKTQTLALKYRPKRWEDVLGQEIPVSILIGALEADDIKPGYCLSGTTGCGKTTCASVFARRLLCSNPQGANPCGECEDCGLIDRMVHPDLKMVDGAADRSVSFVRDVIKPFLAAAPLRGRKKIIIIDEAHQYQKDAISAFLTLLENLPVIHPKSVVILTTTERDSMDPAVLNRCLPLNFGSISDDDIAGSVQNIVGGDFEALRVLAKESGGSFRTVWSYIESWQHTGQDLTEELVMKLVGGVPTTERAKLWEALKAGDGEKVLKLWNKWLQGGARPKTALSYVLEDLTRMAARSPKLSDWVRPMAIVSNALTSGPESTYLATLLRLCGLSLDPNVGHRPGPEEGQPVSLSATQVAPQVNAPANASDHPAAQRLLWFGA